MTSDTTADMEVSLREKWIISSSGRINSGSTCAVLLSKQKSPLQSSLLLSSAYETVAQLIQRPNFVTTKNAFDNFSILDSLIEVVDDPVLNGDSNERKFIDVAQFLSASSHVYSCRVDALYKQAHLFMQGILTTASKEEDGESCNDEEEKEEQYQTTKDENSGTLDQNNNINPEKESEAEKDNIQLKRVSKKSRLRQSQLCDDISKITLRDCQPSLITNHRLITIQQHLFQQYVGHTISTSEDIYCRQYWKTDSLPLFIELMFLSKEQKESVSIVRNDRQRLQLPIVQPSTSSSATEVCFSVVEQEPFSSPHPDTCSSIEMSEEKSSVIVTSQFDDDTNWPSTDDNDHSIVFHQHQTKLDYVDLSSNNSNSSAIMETMSLLPSSTPSKTQKNRRLSFEETLLVDGEIREKKEKIQLLTRDLFRRQMNEYELNLFKEKKHLTSTAISPKQQQKIQMQIYDASDFIDLTKGCRYPSDFTHTCLLSPVLKVNYLTVQQRYGRSTSTTATPIKNEMIAKDRSDNDDDQSLPLPSLLFSDIVTEQHVPSSTVLVFPTTTDGNEDMFDMTLRAEINSLLNGATTGQDSNRKKTEQFLLLRSILNKYLFEKRSTVNFIELMIYLVKNQHKLSLDAQYLTLINVFNQLLHLAVSSEKFYIQNTEDETILIQPRQPWFF
ncbi:unnamed protein product [Didymodactylos carnosus]|uniref:Condensin complex subunit 2 n=1 Tax=Didymodactylos carnosus TaxID=1234261 RepID=A0A813RX16_9BILA|nr:unnamed protein product [Didymodactylos carnosus]CAF1062685.1 unnamed protein product [Didymodactylos carnosus]CAF3572090.1 unnamed protein product [Didymodactylos carnosus]CAF3828032.1 unnamed protein product [Didymodactylos carnosus]